MNALITARYGVFAAERRFQAAAERIAAAPADNSVDVGQEMVEVIQARQAFSANLNVIGVADEMWSALLALQARR